MITNLILTGIIILLLFVTSDFIDDVKLYKNKYKWYSDQYVKARHELSQAQKEINLLKQTKSKQTVTIQVDSDEVVSKFMAKVKKDIEAMKKQEQVFIKVDGREMDINKLTKAMRKAGSSLK